MICINCKGNYEVCMCGRKYKVGEYVQLTELAKKTYVEEKNLGWSHRKYNFGLIRDVNDNLLLNVFKIIDTSFENGEMHLNLQFYRSDNSVYNIGFYYPTLIFEYYKGVPPHIVM